MKCQYLNMLPEQFQAKLLQMKSTVMKYDLVKLKIQVGLKEYVKENLL